MKDISAEFTNQLKSYQQRCPHFQDGICTTQAGCICDKWAQCRSYISALVPKDCLNLELKDFTGMLPNGTPVVSKKVVAKAQREIADYCWNGLPPNFSVAKFDPNSQGAMDHTAIDIRRKEATSLVIHGDYDSDKKPYEKAVPVKMGKSLLATVVMKEVCKRRMYRGHSTDTYEWAPYSLFKARCLSWDNSNVIDYQSCDWLVVDGIFLDDRATPTQKAFEQNKLDAVFMERITQNLPTILVFQFDVSTRLADLQESLGVGISQIVLDENTHKVCLTNPSIKAS